MEIIYKHNWLQLFAEGAGGAPGEGAGDASGAVNAEAAAPQPRRAKRANPLADAQIVTSAEQAAPTNGQAAAGEQSAAKVPFDELIKSDYKADYDASVQKVIQRRFRAAKATEDRLNQVSPIVIAMAERYGIDASDINSIDLAELSRRVSDDNALYEEEAAREGVPVEQYKRFKQLERETARMENMRREEAERAQSRQEYAALLSQAAALKSSVPGFDLDREMSNPAFGRMVLSPPRGSGIPVEAAYYAVHHAEIEEAQKMQRMQLAQYTAQQTTQKMAASIAAGARRPSENGAGANAAVISLIDPTKLTKAERAEIKRRVRSGESISL